MESEMWENLLGKSPALYVHGDFPWHYGYVVMKIVAIDDGCSNDNSNHDDNGDKWRWR